MLDRFPTFNGKPHGAFTDALLRVLEGQLPADLNGDGRLDLNEVHRAVTDFMATRAYGHSPQRLPAVVDDRQGLGSRSVLAATGVAMRPTKAPPAPLQLRLDDKVPATVRTAIGGIPDVRVITAQTPDAQLLARGDRLVLTSGGADPIAELEPSDLRRLQAQVLQLAWAKRLRGLAERHQRAALAMDVHPAVFGGNLRIGEFMHFVVRPERESWLVIVNINADGKVSVLYPFLRNETFPLAAGVARAVPGDSGNMRVEVKAPVGMDTQLAFAFDARPEGLEKLLGVADVPADDARLGQLERMLTQMDGRFSFAQTWLRVAPARPR